MYPPPPACNQALPGSTSPSIYNQASSGSVSPSYPTQASLGNAFFHPGPTRYALLPATPPSPTVHIILLRMSSLIGHVILLGIL